MTPDRQLFVSIRERLHWPERPREPIHYLFPHSDHMQIYYTNPKFFEAINMRVDPLVMQRSLIQYLARIHTPNYDIHHSTDSAATIRLPQAELDFSTSNVATIARVHAIEGDLEQERSSVLVTSLDALLSGYFAKDKAIALEVERERVHKTENFSVMTDALAHVHEGDSFRLIATDRTLDVKMLPFPDDPDFEEPNFYLVGPEETRFPDVISEAKKTSKRIVFQVKSKQWELAEAYLQIYQPDRIAVALSDHNYQIRGKSGEISSSISLPAKFKNSGMLDFLIRPSEGNSDGSVRTEKNRLKRSKTRQREDADVLGLDIVQSGNSLINNKLRRLDLVLPIPCYPVAIRTH